MWGSINRPRALVRRSQRQNPLVKMGESRGRFGRRGWGGGKEKKAIHKVPLFQGVARGKRSWVKGGMLRKETIISVGGNPKKKGRGRGGRENSKSVDARE